MNDADRLARAGNYVFGLMEEAERERAERDLERDASFREAVMEIAERQRLARLGEAPKTDGRWQAVSAQLAGLPQMQALQNEIKPSVASPAAGEPAFRRHAFASRQADGIPPRHAGDSPADCLRAGLCHGRRAIGRGTC